MSLITNSIPQILFKEYLNVPSNRPATAQFYSEIEKYNNYIIGDEIFLKKIPKNPVFINIPKELWPPHFSNLNLTSYQKDETGVLERFERLKMTTLEGSLAVTAYDSNGNNMLKDGFQFNYSGSSSGPFNYELFVNNTFIPRSNETYSYIYNFRSGYISFYNTLPSVSSVEFTFVRYIGPKGLTEFPIDVEGNYNKSILLIDGTVSSPAYSFSNDTTTGIYLDDIKQLGFSVGGQKMMKIYNIANNDSSKGIDILASNIQIRGNYTSTLGINLSDTIIKAINTIDVSGNVAIGSSLAGIETAPINGL